MIQNSLAAREQHPPPTHLNMPGPQDRALQIQMPNCLLGAILFSTGLKLTQILHLDFLSPTTPTGSVSLLTVSGFKST